MENNNPSHTETNVASKNAIDSLLPPAKIHLFSHHTETKELFDSLAEDWRFGRIHLATRGENLENAIEYYSRRKSPTLILIQTDTIDEDFQKRLEDLASLCDEGTAAIVIGPVNDVQLYRHLTNLGISDYLVSPMDKEDLVQAMAGALQNIIGAVDSHLMAFVGVKGGVGTTSIASAMADTLSKSYNAKTLIMDAAGARSTLWNNFGFTPTGSLIEAALAIADNDKETFNRLIVKNTNNLHALNSGTENILDKPVAVEAYEMLLDHCLSIYPNIVLDTSAAPAAIKKVVLARANSICVVTTPSVPALSLTKIMLKALSNIPGGHNKKPIIIVNKAGLAKKEEVSTDDIQKILEIDDLIKIPFDSSTYALAENNGEKISEQKGFTAQEKLFKQMIERSIDLNNLQTENEGNNSSSSGLFSFVNKMIKGDNK